MVALAVIDRPLPSGLPEWLAAGRDLLHDRNRIEWQLADWIADGKHRFGDQLAFDWLADELGIAPKALKDAAKVATAFPPAVRDTALTFEHHASVAILPPSEALSVLTKARADKLDERETRIEAVRRRAELQPPLLSEDDWEQAEKAAIARAYNRARLSVRDEMVEMMVEANGGPIDV